MIARFHFSDGSTKDMLERSAVRGLAKTIRGKHERPVKVEFIDQVADLNRDRWKAHCQSAVAQSNLNFTSEISNTPNCPRCKKAMERTGDYCCKPCNIVMGFRAGGAA